VTDVSGTNDDKTGVSDRECLVYSLWGFGAIPVIYFMLKGNGIANAAFIIVYAVPLFARSFWNLYRALAVMTRSIRDRRRERSDRTVGESSDDG
jgi:hypothetical protein